MLPKVEQGEILRGTAEAAEGLWFAGCFSPKVKEVRNVLITVHTIGTVGKASYLSINKALKNRRDQQTNGLRAVPDTDTAPDQEHPDQTAR